jgi:hypothetical protein
MLKLKIFKDALKISQVISINNILAFFVVSFILERSIPSTETHKNIRKNMKTFVKTIFFQRHKYNNFKREYHLMFTRNVFHIFSEITYCKSLILLIFPHFPHAGGSLVRLQGTRKKRWER